MAKKNNHFIPSPFPVVTSYERAFVKVFNDNLAAALQDAFKYIAGAAATTIKDGINISDLITQPANIPTKKQREIETKKIDINKAVYADTPQNRKLGRVGQEYKRGKGDKKEDIESLKDAINTLPDYPNAKMQGDAKTPLKYGGKELINEVFLQQDKWYDNKIGTKIIDLDKLETLQPIVNRKTLLKKIDNSNHTAEIPVVDYHGRLILIDGNHTAVIKKLKGEKKIKVTLYKFKDNAL